MKFVLLFAMALFASGCLGTPYSASIDYPPEVRYDNLSLVESLANENGINITEVDSLPVTVFNTIEAQDEESFVTMAKQEGANIRFVSDTYYGDDGLGTQVISSVHKTYKASTKDGHDWIMLKKEFQNPDCEWYDARIDGGAIVFTKKTTRG